MHGDKAALIVKIVKVIVSCGFVLHLLLKQMAGMGDHFVVDTVEFGGMIAHLMCRLLIGCGWPQRNNTWKSFLIATASLHLTYMWHFHSLSTITNQLGASHEIMQKNYCRDSFRIGVLLSNANQKGKEIACRENVDAWLEVNASHLKIYFRNQWA